MNTSATAVWQVNPHTCSSTAATPASEAPPPLSVKGFTCHTKVHVERDIRRSCMYASSIKFPRETEKRGLNSSVILLAALAIFPVCLVHKFKLVITTGLCRETCRPQPPRDCLVWS